MYLLDWSKPKCQASGQDVQNLTKLTQGEQQDVWFNFFEVEIFCLQLYIIWPVEFE